MKTLLKILVFTLLLILIGCGKTSPLEGRKTYVQNLNSEMSGVGLPYNYDGPNVNAPRTETKHR